MIKDNILKRLYKYYDTINIRDEKLRDEKERYFEEVLHPIIHEILYHILLSTPWKISVLKQKIIFKFPEMHEVVLDRLDAHLKKFGKSTKSEDGKIEAVFEQLSEEIGL